MLQRGAQGLLADQKLRKLQASRGYVAATGPRHAALLRASRRSLGQSTAHYGASRGHKQLGRSPYVCNVWSLRRAVSMAHVAAEAGGPHRYIQNSYRTFAAERMLYQ